MTWIKDALLDVLSLILIIVFSLTQNSTLEVIIWVYTVILLLGKILYLFVGFLRNRADKTSVPNWFYHVLYISSALILFAFASYNLAICWAAIWILSIVPLLIKSK